MGQPLGKCRLGTEPEYFHLSRRSRCGIHTCRAGHRRSDSGWRNDPHDQAARFHPVPRVGSASLRRKPFEYVCDGSALGKHLLGFYQSAARLSTGWRQCLAECVTPGGPGGRRAQVALGFGDCRNVDCPRRIFLPSQPLYGCVVWVFSISELPVFASSLLNALFSQRSHRDASRFNCGLNKASFSRQYRYDMINFCG